MRNHIPTGAHYPGLRFTVRSFFVLWSMVAALVLVKGCGG